MFKQLHEKFDKLSELIKNNFHRQCEEHYTTRRKMHKEYESIKNKLDNMHKTIASQQHTIEQLTNALKDKYEHGLFIFSEDCKILTVIQNGEDLTNGRVSYVSLDWSVGELPRVTIEHAC